MRSLLQPSHRLAEHLPFCFRARLVCKEGGERVRARIAIPPFYKAVQVNDIVHRIGFNVEEGLYLRRGQLHYLPQKWLHLRINQYLCAALEEPQSIRPELREASFLSADIALWIASREGGDAADLLDHHITHRST